MFVFWGIFGGDLLGLGERRVVWVCGGREDGNGNGIGLGKSV